MSNTSPAAVLSAPVMILAALWQVEHSLLIITTEPFTLPPLLGFMVGVYQTSAP